MTAAASDGDGDELVFTAAGNAANGEVTGVAPHFTYTPDPGFEGEDQFQFNVWDGTAESVGTVTVVVVGSAYDDWRETIEWGGADSSPSGDPNGNGVVNELEFHLGRDPLAEGSELFSRSEVVTQEGVSSYVLEFRRRRNDPALSLQISENSLDDWFDLEFDGVNIIEEVIAPDPLGDGSVEDVRVTLRLTNGPERCFVRFRVVAD